MTESSYLARRVEVRRDDNGAVDEVCTDACGFHLEMLSDKEAWIGLALPNGDEVHVVVTSRGKLFVKAHEA